MRAIVLGAAAGGGFPQWNCGCPGCAAVRAGKEGFTPRTQDSLAVTADGERYVLLNASPDVLVQIQKTPALWPRSPRHSPIAAIVLTNGDLDHVLGLFSLRESMPLAIHATESVWRGLEDSVFLRTLRRFDGQLRKHVLPLEEETELEDAAGAPLGLRVRAFAVPGKLPVHLVGCAEATVRDNVGLRLRASSSHRALTYATTCASLDSVELPPCEVLLFDGTFFREDELVRQGLSQALAKDMAHLPIDGPRGSLERLADFPARKIYTHVNNTNPIVGPSQERLRVEARGWEVAHDGLEIAL